MLQCISLAGIESVCECLFTAEVLRDQRRTQKPLKMLARNRSDPRKRNVEQEYQDRRLDQKGS